jgi:cobalamin transport system substrate-binding protein
MAARTARLIVVAACALAACGAGPVMPAAITAPLANLTRFALPDRAITAPLANLTRFALQTRPAPARTTPQRIVSLVPALTEELFAIGAGPQVVGVSSFDSFPDEVKKLPKVGALLDPDTERILALRPDLVIVYGSQTDLGTQLARAGIRVFEYRHGGIDAVLATIRRLARTTGHVPEGERVVHDIQSRLDAVRARVKGLPRPRTLLVIDRQPNVLRDVYASGGIGFINDMLGIAGGDNVFADVQRESVQPSTEILLTKAPDVILEVRATGMIPPATAEAERKVWSALPSVPAVRNGRIHLVADDALVVPGPRLAQGVETLARTLHPEAFK